MQRKLRLQLSRCHLGACAGGGPGSGSSAGGWTGRRERRGSRRWSRTGAAAARPATATARSATTHILRKTIMVLVCCVWSCQLSAWFETVFSTWCLSEIGLILYPLKCGQNIWKFKFFKLLQLTTKIFSSQVYTAIMKKCNNLKCDTYKMKKSHLFKLYVLCQMSIAQRSSSRWSHQYSLFFVYSEWTRTDFFLHYVE